jgi:hypothetical protein
VRCDACVGPGQLPWYVGGHAHHQLGLGPAPGSGGLVTPEEAALAQCTRVILRYM